MHDKGYESEWCAKAITNIKSGEIIYKQGEITNIIQQQYSKCQQSGPRSEGHAKLVRGEILEVFLQQAAWLWPWSSERIWTGKEGPVWRHIDELIIEVMSYIFLML